MKEFTFTSPGVKFRERNLTYVTRNVGVTTLGLVGETLKGPAFEPMAIEDMGVFRDTFGGMSYEKYSDGNLRYQVPYVANSYLKESSQMYVTRVLGLTGYDAGNAWAITINASGANAPYNNMVVAIIRSKARVTDVVDAPSSVFFKTNSLQITSSQTTDGDIYKTMTMVITPKDDPATTGINESTATQSISFSLNPDAKDYLPNVIGTNTKGKNEYIYVEAIYSDLIRKIDNDSISTGVNTTLLHITNNKFADYKQSFLTPETPWVVSELKGSKVERLFRFILISDGTSANSEIKISIENIDLVNNVFDVVIRDFSDKDNNVKVLESFSRCSMQKELNNYVGSRIGTVDGEFQLKSKYVMLELNEDAEISSFPAGFEGYELPSFATVDTGASTNAVSPKIIYNTKYNPTDNINRTYLGITEKAYVGKGLSQNIFNHYGNTVKVKGKGFHLDKDATANYGVSGEFEVGVSNIQSVSDILDAQNAYNDIKTRKFTLVPYGGFDGWDEHRNNRTHGDLYRKGGIYDGVDVTETPINDYQAWQKAVDTFVNPEEVTINIFATPGINWGDNTTLVKDTLNKIEFQRTDSIYIIDAPNITTNYELNGERIDVRASKDIVGLLETADIDSSYAATYFPYIQMKDVDNNVNVWLPPTCEVVRSMAYTDNVKFPWYAPAGINRGTTSAIKAKYKLTLEARDILYSGRINPLAQYSNTNSNITAIFGQKTLQKQENALDRINVRRLLLELKVLISNISIRLLFDQNDDAVIDEFKTKVNPILQKIQRERGLYEFRIVMDDSINTAETRDRNELYGELYIKPTRTLEFIGVGLTLTPTGASFDEYI